MSNKQIDEIDSSIDLKDIFYRIWSYKLIVIIVTIFSLSGSIFYISTAEKIFRAQTSFIVERNPANLSFTTQLKGNLRVLEGLGGIGADNSVLTLIETMTSREFVLKVASDLNLQADKVFNSFDPTTPEPLWRSAVKSLIGWKSAPIDAVRISNWNILTNFNKRVAINKNDAGAIIVAVDHNDPERAAQIANHIVANAIQMLEQDDLRHASARLDYLSNALADALGDLDTAEKKMQKHAMENSAQALQSFSAGSILLDDLRTKRNISSKQLEAISALKQVATTGSPTRQDYLNLRKRFPILDQSLFRRILGQSEVVSAWNWPTVESLSKTHDSVRDHIESLTAEIKKVEADAARYGQSAELHAAIKRELKIAQATHTVLIEQVKTHSLVAGYSPEFSKINAFADTPISPNHPKPALLLSIGMSFGIVLGSVAALALSFLQGFFYSQSSLIQAVKADFNHKIGALRWSRGKTLREMDQQLKSKSIEWSKEVLLETRIDKSNLPLLIIDSSGLNNAAEIARILGAQTGKMEGSAAIIDLSMQEKTQSDILQNTQNPDFTVIDHINGCTEYKYRLAFKNIDWLFSKSFEKSLEWLIKNHDIVMISGNLDVFNVIYSSPLLEKSLVILLARTKKTKSNLVEKIRQKTKIRVALYG